VHPRYPPEWWNQYDATLADTHKTNKASEGWHNQFALLLEKHHPDMYTFLKELQNEQDDAEVSLAKLALSGKVKASLTEKWLEVYTSAHLLNCPQEGKGSIYRIQLPDRPFT